MNRYSIIKSFLPTIIGGIVFITLLIIFKPSFPVLLLIIMLFSFGLSLYFGKGFFNATKNMLINATILTAIHFLFVWIGNQGVAFVTFGLILIPVVIIIRRWKLFIKTLGDIEEEFFGGRRDKK